MRATEPTRPGALPRRVGLALHPRRDIQAALDTVVDWAFAAGIDLVARAAPPLAGAGRRGGGLARQPRRDVQAALDTVVDWAFAAGIDLVGRDDPRLPGTILRRPDGDLAHACDLAPAPGGGG